MSAAPRIQPRARRSPRRRGQEYLVSLGISAIALSTVSFGKEKPFCNEHNEAAGSKTAAATSSAPSN